MNFEDVHIYRINQINIDIRNAVIKKDWTLKAKLEAEKNILKERIEK